MEEREMSLFFAVVPAQNEAGRIGKVMDELLTTFVDVVVPVVNGSTDGTLAEVAAFPLRRIRPLFFPEALGLDVPRAIGAAYAFKEGAAVVLFVDGDMTQVPGTVLQKLMDFLTSARDTSWGVVTMIALASGMS